jgi:hypothetical protein
MINKEKSTIHIKMYPSREYILKSLGITEAESKENEYDILHNQGFLIEQGDISFDNTFFISGVFSHAEVYRNDQKIKLVDSRESKAKKKRPESIINTEKLNPDWLYLRPGKYEINYEGTMLYYLDDMDFKDELYSDFFE